MQKTNGFTLVLLIAIALASCSPKKSTLEGQGSTFAGHWEGSIGLENGPIRLFLHLDQDTAGRFRGLLDSPDQLAFQIPATGIENNGDSIDVNFFTMMARFQGKLDPSGDRIVGQWSQAQTVAQLTLTRNDDVAFERPQEPKPPFPYVEEPFKITLRDKGTLAGTLTMPQGNGPFPLAILLSGSGAQDRNEEIAGHKPFLVIADHLTRNGVAVLRMDDRGVGGSKGNPNVGADVVAKDVGEVVTELRKNAKINPNKIGLIGHSEGGLVASMAANEDPSLAFVVLLASPALPGDSILKLQYDKMVGKSMPPIMRTLQHQALHLIKTQEDSATLRRSLQQLYEGAYTTAGEQVQSMYKTKEAFASATIRVLMSKPILFLVRHDPKLELEQLRMPVLALYGSKDQQVPAEENVQAMELALRGKRTTRIEVLSDLNHLFQTSRTGELKEYGTIKETFSPAALNLISDWISATVL
jgi:uncharacterized protein